MIKAWADGKAPPQRLNRKITGTSKIGTRSPAMERSINKLLTSDMWAALAGHPYYAPAVELARHIRHKSEPTDSEAVALALAGAQGYLAMRLQPNGLTAEEALQGILRVLDHCIVVKAETLMLHRLVREQPIHPRRPKILRN